LARFLDQRYFELSEDLTSGPVTAEEVLGADLIRMTRKVVSDGTGDDAGLIACEREERSMKADGPAMELSITYNDWFEY
jgi:hypothetical protein